MLSKLKEPSWFGYHTVIIKGKGYCSDLNLLLLCFAIIIIIRHDDSETGPYHLIIQFYSSHWC